MYPASRGRNFTRVALGSSRIDTVTVSSSFSSSDSMIQAGIPILSLGAENSRTPTWVDLRGSRVCDSKCEWLWEVGVERCSREELFQGSGRKQDMIGGIVCEGVDVVLLCPLERTGRRRSGGGWSMGRECRVSGNIISSSEASSGGGVGHGQGLGVFINGGWVENTRKCL